MNHSDPYIFSRGSLKLTYDLLRKGNPALALSIRNITSTVPLSKLDGDVDNPLTDCFLIDLDSFEIRTVVEGLIERSHVKTIDDAGMKVVAQALIEDWMALARAMIAELSEADSQISEKHQP
jgi:hypothetical protein